MLKTTWIGAMDPPRILRDGDVIRNERLMLGPVIYGRVLFTEDPIGILVLGNDCLIENVEIVGTAGHGMGVYMPLTAGA